MVAISLALNLANTDQILVSSPSVLTYDLHETVTGTLNRLQESQSSHGFLY
jgi:hypothetical protein